MTLRYDLIGNRFSQIAKCHSPMEAKNNTKTTFEQMEALGLVGAIEDDKITSANRKKIIQNLIKKQHVKERNT